MKGSISQRTGTIVSEPDKSDVEKVNGEFLRAFQRALSWKWDGRFETVLAEFGVDNKDSVRAILERHLGAIWDSSSIVSAPDILRTVNIRVARLRSGQLLFTSDPHRDLSFFVPGGRGATGKPFLSASRHSLENCQLQKRP